jgi:hypothetical protein
MTTAIRSASDAWTEGELEFLAAARSVIAESYFELPGRMVIRALWVSDHDATFRVNWWCQQPGSDQQRIVRSSFLRVTRVGDSLQLVDLTKGAVIRKAS